MKIFAPLPALLTVLLARAGNNPELDLNVINLASTIAARAAKRMTSSEADLRSYESEDRDDGTDSKGGGRKAVWVYFSHRWYGDGANFLITRADMVERDVPERWQHGDRHGQARLLPGSIRFFGEGESAARWVVFYERGSQVKTSPALASKSLFLRLPALNLLVNTSPSIRD